MLLGMFLVGTFLQEAFIQEPFAGNLLVSGAFFTGTLFAGTFRWELFGRDVLAGALCPKKTPKTVLKTGKIKTSGKIVHFHYGQIFPILVPKPLFGYKPSFLDGN
jgi:hypothetical protein